MSIGFCICLVVQWGWSNRNTHRNPKSWIDGKKEVTDWNKNDKKSNSLVGPVQCTCWTDQVTWTSSHLLLVEKSHVYCIVRMRTAICSFKRRGYLEVRRQNLDFFRLTSLWWHSANVKFFSLYGRKHNYFLHKIIVQQHFWSKYSLQGAPNQAR